MQIGSKRRGQKGGSEVEAEEAVDDEDQTPGSAEECARPCGMHSATTNPIRAEVEPGGRTAIDGVAGEYAGVGGVNEVQGPPPDAEVEG